MNCTLKNVYAPATRQPRLLVHLLPTLISFQNSLLLYSCFFIFSGQPWDALSDKYKIKGQSDCVLNGLVDNSTRLTGLTVGVQQGFADIQLTMIEKIMLHLQLLAFLVAWSVSVSYSNQLFLRRMARAALILFLLLPMIYHGSSRSIKQNLNLLSDGMNQTTHESEILELTELRTTVTCEPVYSFLPCSSTVWGELFMLVVYELLLYLSQQMIQSGSNLFLQMFGTGIFGASLFNVLGVFPQIILLVSKFLLPLL